MNKNNLTSALSGSPGRPRKYDFDRIKVGDSLFVECDGPCIACFQRKISTIAGKQIGKKRYKTRRSIKHGKVGVSVGRVS